MRGSPHCVQYASDTILIFIWIFYCECIYNFKIKKWTFSVPLFPCVCVTLHSAFQVVTGKAGERLTNENSGCDLHMILRWALKPKTVSYFSLPSSHHCWKLHWAKHALPLSRLMRQRPVCGCQNRRNDCSVWDQSHVVSLSLLLGINRCKSLSGTAFKGKPG